MKKISLATTKIPLKAYKNIFDCLMSGRIGRGKYVQMLEEKAASYFNVKHCIAVANGTLADIVMLATLKEMFPNKTEVILPALTFDAQANAVLWAGLKPVFVDIDNYFQIKIKALEEAITEKTLCFFPVHLLGVPGFENNKNIFNMPIPFIEDCCEAMGGEHQFMGGKLKKLGTFGLAGSFSMYPSHTITTGEGGLIITDNDEFARIARSIHNHGKRNQDFDFDYIGINAKMTNMQAAIGCELIKEIELVNLKRRWNVDIYNRKLYYSGHNRHFYAVAPHAYPVYYESKKDRDDALEYLAQNGVEARKLMGCVPDDAAYVKRFGLQTGISNARNLANTGLFVPVHQDLTKKEVNFICDLLLDTEIA